MSLFPASPRNLTKSIYSRNTWDFARIRGWEGNHNPRATERGRPRSSDARARPRRAAKRDRGSISRVLRSRSLNGFVFCLLFCRPGIKLVFSSLLPVGSTGADNRPPHSSLEEMVMWKKVRRFVSSWSHPAARRSFRGPERGGPATFRPALEPLECRIAPALRHWDGFDGWLYGNNTWSDPYNWAEGVAPFPGDDLVFDGQAYTFQSYNNFINNPVFNSLIFPDAGIYTLGGNPITLGSVSGFNPGIRYYSRDTVTLNFAQITLNTDLAFSENGTNTSKVRSALEIHSPINLQNHNLTLDSVHDHLASFAGGTTSGTGQIIKTGAGTWGLYGNNTYTGLTTVNGGGLDFGSPTALGSPVSGTVVNPDGTLIFLDFGQPGQNLVTSEPLTIGGAGGSVWHRANFFS